MILQRRLVLPPRHFLIAGAIALAILGGSLYASRQKPLHTFHPALLSFHASASNAQASVLARSILDDQTVEILAIRAASSGPSDFWSHLELVQQGPATLLVRYDAPDRLRAVLATNAVADTLAAWTPPAQPVAAPEPALPFPQEENQQAKASSPQIEKLQEQLMAVDNRLSFLDNERNEAFNKHTGSGEMSFQAITRQMSRLRQIREKLTRNIAAERKRAAEPNQGQEIAPPSPSPPPSTSVAPQPAPMEKSPFTLVQRASETDSGGGVNQTLLERGVLVALVCAIVYLGLVVRPYKPVLNAQMLEHAVPSKVIFLGKIAKYSDPWQK